MASVDSNLGEVAADLAGVADMFNLNRPGRRGKRLGDDAADVIAAGIQHRTIREQADPDGNPLAPLADGTLRRKAREGYPATIGVETGEMLEFEQIRGQVAMDESNLVMTYGLDAEMQERASYMIEGDPSRNRPARDFYGLDEATTGKLDELLDEAADARLASLRG